MTPPPSRRSVGSAARERRTALITTRLKASLQAASSKPSTVPKIGPPQLFTRTSRPPSVATAHSINALHSSPFRKSATLASMRYPSFRRAFAATSRCSALCDEMATWQPSPASARTDANPSPLLAAVTSARRPRSRISTWLLAYASVDPLAQQVGVTHVAGVLLDRSDQHLAQRHRPSAAAVLVQWIVAGDIETGRPGHEPRGEVHLRTPCVPCLRDHLRVGNSTIEITVAGAEQPGRV